jgi:hypothetical protein
MSIQVVSIHLPRPNKWLFDDAEIPTRLICIPARSYEFGGSIYLSSKHDISIVKRPAALAGTEPPTTATLSSSETRKADYKVPTYIET